MSGGLSHHTTHTHTHALSTFATITLFYCHNCQLSSARRQPSNRNQRGLCILSFIILPSAYLPIAFPQLPYICSRKLVNPASLSSASSGKLRRRHRRYNLMMSCVDRRPALIEWRAAARPRGIVAGCMPPPDAASTYYVQQIKVKLSELVLGVC